MTESSGEGQGSGTTLLLRVLGPTTLERGGQPLNIGGRRQRAVLARLASAEGRLVTVDRLVEDLWGDGAQPSILTTLHGYISRLRTAMQEPNRIRREGPGYVLDVSPDEVDARIFERLASSGRQVLATDPAKALDHFERAIGLWRGPAYADLIEMDWARAAATRLEELRFSAVESRFDAMLRLGRHAAVVALSEEALHESPLREQLAGQLMLALYRAGRQAEALRVFERTRRHLLDELGLDPSPDLVRLQAAILAHEPGLAAPVSQRPIPPSVTPSEPQGTIASDGGPAQTRLGASPVTLPPAVERHLQRLFVGRAGELAALREAWQGALADRRRLVMIEGEAGSGKSRLAAHFAAEAHAAGAIILWGRATTEAIVPYEPLVEALRTVLRTVSPDARHRVIDGRKGLAMLLPFITDAAVVSEISQPELGTDRYVLFETVAELLDAESAESPIVFVLDDLQWADPLSIRLLQHLLQHERPARVLVIGTVRTVPATDNPHLDSLINDLRRQGLLTSLELGGLEQHEVAELLDASGQQAGAARAAAIHRATHGNPFFVTELARHGDDATLPASVRDVLAERLARMSASTSRLLAVTATAGPTASLPVLTQASGLDHDDFVDAVDEAIAAGLLTEEDSGGEADAGSITFRHSLVQQAVLERLSHTRRRAHHLTLADTLDALGAGRLEVAHHLLEAGALAGPERTVRAAVGAGREALAMLAYEDGSAWAQRALGVPGVVDPPGRCEALLLRSDAQRALGDRIAAREAAVAAADAARQAADPLLLARSAEAMALARSGIGFDFGTEDKGLDRLLVEALKGLPDSEITHRSRLLEASMANAAADGDLLALNGLSRDALELAAAHGQHSLVATAHLASRMSNWNVRLLEQRLAADRQAWEAAALSGSLHLQMNALLYGIVDLTEAGLVHEAKQWLERLRDRAAEVRQPVYDAFVGFMDATRKLLEGDYARSSQLVDEALVRGLHSHGVNAEQAWAGQLFIRAWDRGELAALTDTVEQAAARPPQFPIWRVARGLCLVASGRPDEARPVLEEMVGEDGIAHNPDSLWLAVAALLVEIARAVGDSERAAILLRELLPFRRRMIMTGLGRASLGPVDRVMGVAAHVAGDLDTADRLLASAVEQAQAMGAIPHVARALHDRAAVLEERDGEADPLAQELRVRARELADRIGLVLDSLAISPSR